MKIKNSLNDIKKEIKHYTSLTISNQFHPYSQSKNNLLIEYFII